MCIGERRRRAVRRRRGRPSAFKSTATKSLATNPSRDAFISVARPPIIIQAGRAIEAAEILRLKCLRWPRRRTCALAEISSPGRGKQSRWRKLGGTETPTTVTASRARMSSGKRAARIIWTSARFFSYHPSRPPTW